MAKNKSDLLPFLGCCCTIASFYYEYPSCIGCSGNFDCLIISSEWRICKMKEGKVTNYRISKIAISIDNRSNYIVYIVGILQRYEWHM